MHDMYVCAVRCYERLRKICTRYETHNLGDVWNGYAARTPHSVASFAKNQPIHRFDQASDIIRMTRGEAPLNEQRRPEQEDDEDGGDEGMEEEETTGPITRAAALTATSNSGPAAAR